MSAASPSDDFSPPSATAPVPAPLAASQSPESLGAAATTQ